jgi:hypothetical protein
VYTASLPNADWTLAQLRISDQERSQRISHRARLLGQSIKALQWWVDTAANEERLLAGEPFADHILNISGLDRSQVVDLVLTRTGWPPRQPPS